MLSQDISDLSLNVVLEFDKLFLRSPYHIHQVGFSPLGWVDSFPDVVDWVLLLSCGRAGGYYLTMAIQKP